MTRIAVLSDVHGNRIGLDAALADLQTQHADQIVFLGDMIQGGPQPAAVVERLRALNAPVVMGNADAWLLSGVDTGGEPTTEMQRAVRAWQLTQLSDADRAYIQSFQPTVELALDKERRLLCFHGSPESFDEIILPSTPEDEFQRILGPFAPAVMCGGHTHLPQIRRLGDTFFFNPGSTGFSYGHQQAAGSFKADPWADYAIISCDNGVIGLEFRRVPFNVEALIQAYTASGRPYTEVAVAQYTKEGQQP